MSKQLFLIILTVISLQACKVKYSFTGASIPPEAKTVSIAEFPNMAPLINPMLSITFTEALRQKFMSQTDLQLIGSGGDLSFEGTIIKYDTRPINIQAGTDQAAQNRLTIAVKVKFTNIYDPKSNFETTFSRYSDYSSDKNLQDVEDALVTEIVAQLVTDIFNKSVVNW